MDIIIPIADAQGNAIDNALGERIVLPERVEDRSPRELLTGNTKNRIFELMVNYVLHDLAQIPNNDMKKARRAMRGITFNHKFKEQDTDSYKFSAIEWQNRLENLHAKIGDVPLYEENSDDSLLKKHKITIHGKELEEGDKEYEQRKQQFVLQGSKTPFYLKSRMNLVAHSGEKIPPLEGQSITELSENRDKMVGYYYDRGSIRNPFGPQEQGRIPTEQLESKQTELMNAFMIEGAMIHEDILSQDGVVEVIKKSDKMVVTINTYLYWSKVFEKQGFGKLKDLKTWTVGLTEEQKEAGTRRAKPRNVKGKMNRKTGKREILYAWETERMDDPETGFFEVSYTQRQPARKKAKGWTKKKPKWAETKKDWEKRYRGASRQDFTMDDPKAHALTLTGVEKTKKDARGNPVLDENDKPTKIKSIVSGGLLAEKEEYSLPSTKFSSDAYTGVMNLATYLENLKEPSFFKKQFLENIFQIKTNTSNMGSRDESGYVTSRPEYHYEISEFLIPRDQTLILGQLKFEYSLDYQISRGQSTYDLTDARLLRNLFSEGTASAITAQKIRGTESKDQHEKDKIKELLREITSNQSDVNHEKPSPKFYEWLIQERFVEELSPSEIEERLEDLGDYGVTSDDEYGSSEDEEILEEREQTTEINPLELRGDYKNTTELEEILEEGREQGNVEDEKTPKLVDPKHETWLEPNEFKTYMQEFTDDTPEQYGRKIKIIKQRLWNEHNHLINVDHDDKYDQTARVVPIRINHQSHQTLAVVKASPSGKIQSDLKGSRFAMQDTKTKGKVSLAQKNQTLILTVSKAYNTLGKIIGFIGNKKGA